MLIPAWSSLSALLVLWAEIASSDGFPAYVFYALGAVALSGGFLLLCTLIAAVGARSWCWGLAWLFFVPAAAVASVGFYVLGRCIVVEWLGYGRHPTQTELVDRFIERRATFEELREFLFGQLARSEGEPYDWGAVVEFHGERTPRYFELIDAVDAQWAGIVDVEARELRVVVTTRGFSASGSDAGYLYSPTPPSRLLRSLDEIPAQMNGSWHVGLGDDWYLQSSSW